MSFKLSKSGVEVDCGADELSSSELLEDVVPQVSQLLVTDVIDGGWVVWSACRGLLH
jgi:hypothetical protein